MLLGIVTNLNGLGDLVGNYAYVLPSEIIKYFNHLKLTNGDRVITIGSICRDLNGYFSYVINRNT